MCVTGAFHLCFVTVLGDRKKSIDPVCKNFCANNSLKFAFGTGISSSNSAESEPVKQKLRVAFVTNDWLVCCWQ